MSRTPARHGKPPRSAPARSGAGSRHRKTSAGPAMPASPAMPPSPELPPRIALPPRSGKPVKVVAAAVAGSALALGAWPAAAHLIGHAPHRSGTGQAGTGQGGAGQRGTGQPAAGQADALGVPATGAHRKPASPAPTVPASLSAHDSQQIEIVSIAIGGRPGKHRKPGYANPLRAISGLTPERIDQGVDFSGSGPIYALGDAVITNASDGYLTGWPGGGWISYQLTDGPDAGLEVYVAEDVTPAVQVGEHVTSSTVIANMFSGPDGIETGWAAPLPLTAESSSVQAGGINGGGPFPTRVGVSFDNLLRSVGVPAAPNYGQGAYGILPQGYPG